MTVLTEISKRIRQGLGLSSTDTLDERDTFLKAAILPSFERVPSGKNSTDAPCANGWSERGTKSAAACCAHLATGQSVQTGLRSMQKAATRSTTVAAANSGDYLLEELIALQQALHHAAIVHSVDHHVPCTTCTPLHIHSTFGKIYDGVRKSQGTGRSSCDCGPESVTWTAAAALDHDTISVWGPRMSARMKERACQEHAPADDGDEEVAGFADELEWPVQVEQRVDVLRHHECT